MTLSELEKKLVEEFVEKGAALEHERWAKWQNYLHSFLAWNGIAWELPHEKKEHWQRQIETPYVQLSEKEKESDRKETRNYTPLLLHALKTQREEIRKMVEGMKEDCDKCDSNTTGNDAIDEILEALKEPKE